MKQVPLGTSGVEVPAMAVGCMRIESLKETEAERFLQSALELGANFFDHADIYGHGACESLFGSVLQRHPEWRSRMLIQSKCGIVPGVMYDCSKKHILEAVEGSLKRLHTDYLDVLLLHRPDALMEPEEVAEAFDLLHREGKVRYFGVSNQKPSQMALLSRFCRQPLMVNQLQFSLTNSHMISSGMEVNMETEGAVERDGSVLDYCRRHQVTIQAWSPFQHGFFGGVFLDDPAYPELNQALQEVAEAHGLTKTGTAAAWILRHPAGMQILTGTMKVSRLEEIARAADVELTREEWYRLYRAAGHILP